MDSRIFWSDQRLGRLSFALLIAIGLAIVFQALTDLTHSGQLYRGDYPGFYVLAKILHDARSASLYDPELQRVIENSAWPEFNGQFYMSVYPPFTAALLYPLGFFSPIVGKILWTIGSILLYCASFWILGDSKKNKLAAGVFLLCSAPILSGVLGGQMSAIILFICTLIFKFNSRTDLQSRICTGLLVSLLLCKPQWGALAALFLLVTLDKVKIFSWISGVLILFLLGVAVLGWNWPEIWLASVRTFATHNLIVNASNQTSIYSLAWVFSIPKELLYLSGLFLLLISLRQFISSKHNWLVALATIPVIVPQTLFYDLTPVLFAAFLVTDWNKDQKILAAFGFILLCDVALWFRDLSFIPPAIVIALYLWLFIRRNLKESYLAS